MGKQANAVRVNPQFADVIGALALWRMSCPSPRILLIRFSFQHTKLAALHVERATSAAEATCESDADCRRLSFQAASVGISCDASTRRCICSNRTLVLTRRGTCLPSEYSSCV
ncbi:hypothetical protein HPB50_003796 [Hyalomma asiaticum]|uniref:Uncharacterized protein n=1 Tax=Hyalomma asiaticum TaxID=266040 RepID=A0ACB7S4V0_HYAAI|nr:hypothetical protein HPB50_003796 [Hyalomma asiaticum]